MKKTFDGLFLCINFFSKGKLLNEVIFLVDDNIVPFPKKAKTVQERLKQHKEQRIKEDEAFKNGMKLLREQLPKINKPKEKDKG